MNVEQFGDKFLVVDALGAILYDEFSLQGLSERCINRLAELCEENDWNECSLILESEGFSL